MVDTPLKKSRGFMRDEGGQALTETAIALPVYLLIIVGLFFFGESYNHKIKVVQAARYAASLYAAGNDNYNVREMVWKGYFSEYDKGRVHVKDSWSQGSSDVGDHTTTGGGSGNLIQKQNGLDVYQLISGTFLPVITRAEVTFDYGNPFSDSNIDPFTENSYSVRSRFIVEANPWAYEEIEDESWFTTYATMLLTGVGGTALGELSKLWGNIF